MTQDFKKVMQCKSDQELIKIIYLERDNYTPMALATAEQELKDRNISQDEIENIVQEHTALEETIATEAKREVGFGLRAANFIIDLIVWSLIAFVLTLPFSVSNPTEKILGNLIMFISFILYFTIMELKFQQTIGKMITKTKVVTQENAQPELKALLLRSFFRLFFPFLPLLYFFTSHRWLHDMVSDTKVVKIDSANH